MRLGERKQGEGAWILRGPIDPMGCAVGEGAGSAPRQVRATDLRHNLPLPIAGLHRGAGGRQKEGRQNTGETGHGAIHVRLHGPQVRVLDALASGLRRRRQPTGAFPFNRMR